MQMVILAGPARVGKTTIAKCLATFAFKVGLRPQILPFAGAIKEEAKASGITKEEKPEEYRQYCQSLGSLKRQEDPEYWLKRFDKIVNGFLKEEKKRLNQDVKYWETIILIDDCRYMNEVAYGKEKNATLIFVSPGERLLPDHNAEWRQHESEVLATKVLLRDKDYQDIFPWIIRNETTLKDLKRKLKSVQSIWCGVDPNIHYTTCDCELCVSRRQDRPPNIEILISQTLEKIIEEDDE